MKALVTLIGRIGNPGELKTVGDTVKLGFTLATDHREKVGGEWVSKPTWWTITVWGKAAEYLAPKIAKGIALTAIGEAWEEPWVGRDGEKRSTLRCRADTVILHVSPKSAAPTPGGETDPAIHTSEHPPRSPRPADAGNDEPPF